jgi:hypothetical protein
MHRERGMPQGAKSQLAHRFCLPLADVDEREHMCTACPLPHPTPTTGLCPISVTQQLRIFALARVCKKART